MVGRDRGLPLKRDWVAGDNVLPMPEPSPSNRDIPLSWVGYDELPIAYANQFLVQNQPDGSFLFSVGQVSPPALVGDPANMAAQLEDLEFVAIRPLLRAVLTEATMRELLAVLEASLRKADQRQQTLDPRGGDQP